MKYGLFEYSTANIGDEIQSIAARRFLPRIDYYFDRDNIDATDTHGDKVKLIMNGWYTERPESFPPKSKNIEPLLVSMHVERYAHDGALASGFCSDQGKAFLAKYGPVGTRDEAMLDFFQELGIDAYFSGCLTLTLNADKKIKKQDFILAVDVSDKIYEKMKTMTKRKIVRLNVIRCAEMSRDAKFALAEYFLALYQSAYAVVTSRLHCMLPCLAFGTPVLVIEKKKEAAYRFSGLIDLTRHVTEEKFLDVKFDEFSLEKPPKNPNSYKKIRDELVKTCKKFTGFDSEGSYLSYGSLEELVSSDAFCEAMTCTLTASYEKEKIEQQYKILQDGKDWLDEQYHNHLKEIKRLENTPINFLKRGIRKVGRMLKND